MDGDSAKVFRASDELQRKAGKGAINPRAVNQAEKTVENKQDDFLEYAKEHLENLNNAIDNAQKADNYSKDQLFSEIQKPLMGLKSGAGLYGFDLVGRLADIIFNFIEQIDNIDDKVIEILTAQSKTLFVIISNNMKGDGGEQGKELERELKGVCKKYLTG